MKRKIIIDTDPGIDDAMAIIAAYFMEEFDILGITTVEGNIPVKRCNENALGLVNYLQASIPVYPGANKPIKENIDNPKSTFIHGDKGIGGVVLPMGNQRLESMSAEDFIIDMVKLYPNEIEIIAIGPLTNLALAITKEPEIMKKLKGIWSMGGGHERGNASPYAEFNYWADPLATQITLDYGKYFPIYMYGLHVTHQTPFHPEDILYIGSHGGSLGKLMLDMNLHYLRAYKANYGKLDFVIHDLLAVLGAIEPTLATYVHCPVEVITTGPQIGETLCKVNEKETASTVYVAMTVDTLAYKQLFIKSIFPDLLDDYNALLTNMYGKSMQPGPVDIGKSWSPEAYKQ